MAEKIVSPGVFTKENDLSFLQQGVAEIGAAFIGPFKEGPLVPTIVNSQADFETMFGVVDDTYYTPLAVQSYLREAGTATICRVGGVGGYTENAPLLLTATSESVSASLGILFNTEIGANGGFAGETLEDADGNGDFVLSTLGSASLDVTDINDIEAVFGTSPFGSKDAYVYGFFKNSNITFDSHASASVNVLGNQLFNFDAQEALTPIIQSQLISGDRFPLFRFETMGAGNSANTKVKIGISNIKAAGSINGTDYGTFTVVVRDFADTNKKKIVLETYSNVNLDPNSPNYISRVIGDRKLLINSEGKITETGDWVNNSKYVRVSGLNEYAPIQSVPFGHDKYTLPVSASAEIGARIPAVTFLTASLTQFGGIDLDNNTDNSIYLKPIPNNAGKGSNSVFGLDVANGQISQTFVVTVQNVYGVNVYFIGGDEKPELNLVRGGVYTFDLSNVSTAHPFRFRVGGVGSDQFTEGVVITGTQGEAGANVVFTVPNSAPNTLQYYCTAHPAAMGNTINVANGSLSVGSTSAQFVVAFQEGFDGMSPATPIYKGADITSGNSQGFNLSTSTSSGTLAYGKHIAALSNADEFDINMIVTPGVIKRLHSSVATSVLDMVEQRNDCFYIMDSTSVNDSIAQVNTEAQSIDSNMVATYYPWIKTIDINTNKLISIPPSVLLPGVFAANDRVAAEWFAPAGLNRGGLVGAVSVINRLTQSEKDSLYENKVNPIVQFPGQGIVVFGQKTLQDRPSALDRINVRRLLLTVRKFIASSSRFLVFEQNTSETRNRFLNIVNPFLEGIQQRQGLFAFRVTMDESNNTPDVVDRNIMKGAIFLQPTRTAEFIQIDFNILPTGAAFSG